LANFGFLKVFFAKMAKFEAVTHGKDAGFQRNSRSGVKSTMKEMRSWKSVWKESRSVLAFLLVMFAVRSAIADWNDVPTGSMNPTIVQGDRVWVNKLAYDLKAPFTTWHLARWADPQRGDIVVFFSPEDGQRLVKRVIGLPGDTIESRDDHLLINGHAAAYDLLPLETGSDVPQDNTGRRIYAKETADSIRPHPVMILPERRALRTFGPITVPPGKYFMMGDNRDNSNDSRFWGTVDRSQIVGRASMIVLSLDHQRFYEPRWRRFFSALL
jgi:signal peptidase I